MVTLEWQLYEAITFIADSLLEEVEQVFVLYHACIATEHKVIRDRLKPIADDLVVFWDRVLNQKISPQIWQLRRRDWALTLRSKLFDQIKSFFKLVGVREQVKEYALANLRSPLLRGEASLDFSNVAWKITDKQVNHAVLLLKLI